MEINAVDKKIKRIKARFIQELIIKDSRTLEQLSKM